MSEIPVIAEPGAPISPKKITINYFENQWETEILTVLDHEGGEIGSIYLNGESPEDHTVSRLGLHGFVAALAKYLGAEVVETNEDLDA